MKIPVNSVVLVGLSLGGAYMANRLGMDGGFLAAWFAIASVISGIAAVGTLIHANEK